MMLVTVRPGPVLHVWRDGQELAALPLDASATLTLVRSLLAALQDHPQRRKGKDNG